MDFYPRSNVLWWLNVNIEILPGGGGGGGGEILPEVKIRKRISSGGKNPLAKFNFIGGKFYWV